MEFDRIDQELDVIFFNRQISIKKSRVNPSLAYLSLFVYLLTICLSS